MKRFYTDQPFPEAGSSFELEERLSHYLGRVLRLKTGTELMLFNGSGKEALSTLTAISKQSTTAEVKTLLPSQPESPIHTHLGQVISKGERMDFAIQKAVELGVTEITPLLSERCDVRLNQDRITKRLQHWQAVAVSACEQSGRGVVPVINPVTQLEGWLSNASQGLVLSPIAERSLSTTIDGLAPSEVISILIGPEGGLIEQEIVSATEAGLTATRMGPRVLRTETAPLTVLSALQLMLGDFK